MWVYRRSTGGKTVNEYGQQTDYGKGPMHIVDFGMGMPGANGIVRTGSTLRRPARTVPSSGS
jgi:hypothetical protein